MADPEDRIGGLSTTVRMDTTPLDADMARVRGMLDTLGNKFAETGTRAAASTHALSAGMTGVATSANLAGNKIQTLGYFLDDLQYVGEQGLRPILNQLMQISPAIGIAVLAADQLIQRMGGWKEVMSQVGLTNPIETAAEEMARLGKETARTADEQDRLNRLQKESAAIQAIRGGESAADRSVAAGVQAAVDEADYRKVRDAVMANQRREGLAPGMTPEDVAALERERAFHANPLAKIPGGLFGFGLGAQAGMAKNVWEGYGTDARKTIEDRLAREANEAADRLIADAKLSGAVGDAARAQLRKYGLEDPTRLGAFGAAIGKIYPATPQSSAIDAQTDAMLRRKREGDPSIDEQTDVMLRHKRADDAMLARARGDAARQQAGLDREARDRLPGLGRMAEREYLNLLGATRGDAEKARAALEERLKAQFEGAGMNGLKAWQEAHEMAGKVARGVNEDIMDRAMNPVVRNSQVFDAAQLNASVQQSINNANPQLKVQQDMLKQLSDIALWTQNFDLGQPVRAGGR